MSKNSIDNLLNKSESIKYLPPTICLFCRALTLALLCQGIIRQLVSAAADVKSFIEYQDTSGHTPLTIACRSGHYECAALVDFGIMLQYITCYTDLVAKEDGLNIKFAG